MSTLPAFGERKCFRQGCVSREKFLCLRCIAPYCSTECQVQDSPKHDGICKTIPTCLGVRYTDGSVRKTDFSPLDYVKAGGRFPQELVRHDEQRGEGNWKSPGAIGLDSTSPRHGTAHHNQQNGHVLNRTPIGQNGSDFHQGGQRFDHGVPNLQESHPSGCNQLPRGGGSHHRGRGYQRGVLQPGPQRDAGTRATLQSGPSLPGFASASNGASLLGSPPGQMAIPRFPYQMPALHDAGPPSHYGHSTMMPLQMNPMPPQMNPMPPHRGRSLLSSYARSGHGGASRGRTTHRSPIVPLPPVDPDIRKMNSWLEFYSVGDEVDVFFTVPLKITGVKWCNLFPKDPAKRVKYAEALSSAVDVTGLELVPISSCQLWDQVVIKKGGQFVPGRYIVARLHMEIMISHMELGTFTKTPQQQEVYVIPPERRMPPTALPITLPGGVQYKQNAVLNVPECRLTLEEGGVFRNALGDVVKIYDWDFGFTLDNYGFDVVIPRPLPSLGPMGPATLLAARIDKDAGVMYVGFQLHADKAEIAAMEELLDEHHELVLNTPRDTLRLKKRSQAYTTDPKFKGNHRRITALADMGPDKPFVKARYIDFAEEDVLPIHHCVLLPVVLAKVPPYARYLRVSLKNRDVSRDLLSFFEDLGKVKPTVNVALVNISEDGAILATMQVVGRNEVCSGQLIQDLPIDVRLATPYTSSGSARAVAQASSPCPPVDLLGAISKSKNEVYSAVAGVAQAMANVKLEPIPPTPRKIDEPIPFVPTEMKMVQPGPLVPTPRKMDEPAPLVPTPEKIDEPTPFVPTPRKTDEPTSLMPTTREIDEPTPFVPTPTEIDAPTLLVPTPREIDDPAPLALTPKKVDEAPPLVPTPTEIGEPTPLVPTPREIDEPTPFVPTPQETDEPTPFVPTLGEIDEPTPSVPTPRNVDEPSPSVPTPSAEQPSPLVQAPVEPEQPALLVEVLNEVEQSPPPVEELISVEQLIEPVAAESNVAVHPPDDPVGLPMWPNAVVYRKWNVGDEIEVFVTSAPKPDGGFGFDFAGHLETDQEEYAKLLKLVGTEDDVEHAGYRPVVYEVVLALGKLEGELMFFRAIYMGEGVLLSLDSGQVLDDVMAIHPLPAGLRAKQPLINLFSFTKLEGRAYAEQLERMRKCHMADVIVNLKIIDVSKAPIYGVAFVGRRFND